MGLPEVVVNRLKVKAVTHRPEVGMLVAFFLAGAVVGFLKVHPARVRSPALTLRVFLSGNVGNQDMARGKGSVAGQQGDKARSPRKVATSGAPLVLRMLPLERELQLS